MLALLRALALPIRRIFVLRRHSVSAFPWFPLNSRRGLVYSDTCDCGHNYLSYHHYNKSDREFKRRDNRKHTKSIDKEDVDKRVVYMRDTILKIYNILKYSTWDSAQDELRNIPTKWDSYTVNQVLKTHPPMEKAWLFFNWVEGLKGFKHDQFTYTTMLDIFGEAGRVSSMKFVFKQMQEKGINIDAVTCTSLMHWISESGDVDGAVKVWEEMRAIGCSPTVVSYTAYMKILFCNSRVKEAMEAYKEMLRSGVSPNCHTYTVLMEYLIGSGKCKEALEIFGKMQEAKVHPDKAACNILVEKLSKSGDTWAISEILQYMKENRIVLRYPVFVDALEALKSSGENDGLLRQVNRHCSVELPGEDSGRTAKADKRLTADEELILALLRKENLLGVDILLAGITGKNTRLDPAVISTIIDVNCDRRRLDEALRALEYSVKTGITIPRSAYLALLGSLIRSDFFPKVVTVVEEMISARHSIGIYLASVLIHKLGRSGKPKLASRVFNVLPCDHKCASTYTALIGAYFSVGNFDKGLEIFRTMPVNGVVPSLGTYSLVLTGLSRSGKVSELEVLKKEKRRFQIDHSDCRNIKPFEEEICDLLFVKDVIVW